MALVADTFGRFAAEQVAPRAEVVHRDNRDVPEEVIGGLAAMGTCGGKHDRTARRRSGVEVWRVLAGEFAARIFTETGGCDHVEPPDGDSARGNGEKASQEAYDLSMTANRSRKLRLRISALAIPLTILAIACGGDAVDSSDSTAPPAAGSAAEVYSLNCARCHGAEFEGGFGPALGAGSRVVDLEDAELIEIITEGRNTMPGWGDRLSPEQITDLVAFVREPAAGG